MSKGVISRPVKLFTKFSILAKLSLAKKCPKFFYIASYWIYRYSGH